MKQPPTSTGIHHTGTPHVCTRWGGCISYSTSAIDHPPSDGLKSVCENSISKISPEGRLKIAQDLDSKDFHGRRDTN
jgi:hypothetical protein